MVDCPKCSKPFFVSQPNCTFCDFENIYSEFAGDLKPSKSAETQLQEIFQVKKEETLTVWKCLKCGVLNKLGDDSKCSGDGCNFDIQHGDDLPEFMDMTEE